MMAPTRFRGINVTPANAVPRGRPVFTADNIYAHPLDVATLIAQSEPFKELELISKVLVDQAIDRLDRAIKRLA